jgi:hypothetical protein
MEEFGPSIYKEQLNSMQHLPTTKCRPFDDDLAGCLHTVQLAVAALLPDQTLEIMRTSAAVRSFCWCPLLALLVAGAAAAVVAAMSAMVLLCCAALLTQMQECS